MNKHVADRLPTVKLQTISCDPVMFYLSEKALISQRSSSSSATQVSSTTGPVCLAGSGFFGRRALERSPFRWGVWVSADSGKMTEAQGSKRHILIIYSRKKHHQEDKNLTLGGLGHPKWADDLADAVLRANAVRSHVSPLDDLRGGDLRIWGLCGEEMFGWFGSREKGCMDWSTSCNVGFLLIKYNASLNIWITKWLICTTDVFSGWNWPLCKIER